MIYVGIDPGAEGAVGVTNGQRHDVFDIPTLKVKRSGGKKTVFDYPKIVTLFRQWNEFRDQVMVALEQPPPSMGPGKGSPYGQFRLGIAYGMWPLFLTLKGLRFEEVSPSVWKRQMGVGADKEQARHTAMKLFPHVSLSRKKDHNRAEALLLAEWLRRKCEGGK